MMTCLSVGEWSARKTRSHVPVIDSLCWKQIESVSHNPEVVGSNPAPATTLCDQKRYRTEKARNHAVSGLFSCPVLTAQKKDIFPPFTRVVRT